MKRFFIKLITVVFVLFAATSYVDAVPNNNVPDTVKTEVVKAKKKHKRKWFEMDSRIEVVNETTVIFNDVVKIEIRTNNPLQVTYVYDLRRGKVIKVAKGSFSVDVVKGKYLIQSDKKITKTVYEVVIE